LVDTAPLESNASSDVVTNDQLTIPEGIMCRSHSIRDDDDDDDSDDDLKDPIQVFQQKAATLFANLRTGLVLPQQQQQQQKLPKHPPQQAPKLDISTTTKDKTVQNDAAVNIDGHASVSDKPNITTATAAAAANTHTHTPKQHIGKDKNNRMDTLMRENDNNEDEDNENDGVGTNTQDKDRDQVGWFLRASAKSYRCVRTTFVFGGHTRKQWNDFLPSQDVCPQ